MLSVAAISDHPNLMSILHKQAIEFLDVEVREPRAAAVFATQQRFLLAQLGVSMLFRRGKSGLLLTHFIDDAVQYGIASRNTAHSFMLEMLHYNFTHYGEAANDKRTRPIMLSPSTIRFIEIWIGIHLTTLDRLDDGTRIKKMAENPGLLFKLQPLIAEGILKSPHAAQNAGTFSLFNWMNDGSLVMDKMFSNISMFDSDAGRLLTGIHSFEELAEPLRITRTHLARKMLEAEKQGSVGWSGKRGKSALWLSESFVNEYKTYQSAKLAMMDQAFHSALKSPFGN